MVCALRSAAMAQRRTSTIRLTFAVTLRARAQLNAGKACGTDGVSVELLKTLTWRSVRVIHTMFSDIFEGKRETPRPWMEVLVTLMPKVPS